MKRLTWLIIALVVAGIPVFAQGRQGMMGGGPGGHQQEMQTIHALFSDHQKIRRTVRTLDEGRERGVETLTESDDPRVQALITTHAVAMQQRLAKGQPIRMWDPLFAALFEHAAKIRMEVIPTPKGVRVVETSTDPYVVSLIQAHAAGVTEFVTAGPSVMHKSHPLPTVDDAGFLGKGDGINTCPVSGQPVDRAIKFGFDGRTVYFCSASCREAFKKSPESYLRPAR